MKSCVFLLLSILISITSVPTDAGKLKLKKRELFHARFETLK